MQPLLGAESNLLMLILDIQQRILKYGEKKTKTYKNLLLLILGYSAVNNALRAQL